MTRLVSDHPVTAAAAAAAVESGARRGRQAALQSPGLRRFWKLTKELVRLQRSSIFLRERNGGRGRAGHGHGGVGWLPEDDLHP